MECVRLRSQTQTTPVQITSGITSHMAKLIVNASISEMHDL